MDSLLIANDAFPSGHNKSPFLAPAPIAMTTEYNNTVVASSGNGAIGSPRRWEETLA